jgi:hypothetical protein
MLKEFFAGIKKFINRKEMVIVVIAVVVAIALLSYSNSKSRVLGYEGNANIGSYSSATDAMAKQPSVLETSAQFVADAPEGASMANGLQLNPTTNPSDLLPTDSNSEWAKLNPTFSAGATPDLLQPGYQIGLDTVGQSMKNANLQLRSDPIIPKNDSISPWGMSTIEPDMMRVPFEVGSA